MHQQDFRNMEKEEYADFLKTRLKTINLKKELVDKSHAFDRHYVKSDRYLISRCYEEGHSASTFLDSDDREVKYGFDECLERELHNPEVQNRIAEWMVSETDRPLIIRYGFNCCIGAGFEAGTYKKKDTNKTVIQLEKDYRNTSLGWYVYTFYPDIDRQEAKYVDQYITDPYKDGHVIVDDLEVARTEVISREDVSGDISEDVQDILDELEKNKKKKVDRLKDILMEFSAKEHIPMEEIKLSFPPADRHKDPYPRIEIRGTVVATINTRDGTYRTKLNELSFAKAALVSRLSLDISEAFSKHTNIPPGRIKISLPYAGSEDDRVTVTADDFVIGHIPVSDDGNITLNRLNVRRWHHDHDYEMPEQYRGIPEECRSSRSPAFSGRDIGDL